MNYKNLSPQSKSFIVLFLIALVGTYGALLITSKTNFPGSLRLFSSDKGNVNGQSTTPEDQHPRIPVRDEDPSQQTEAVDMSGWKTYTDATYPLSFRYPPDWKVKSPATEYGYYSITIDPGAKFDNIHVYASTTGFFAMEGLPAETETIAGQQAKNVQGVLFGIPYQNVFYTFDEGASMSIKSKFQAMVRSVTFTR